MNNNDLNNLSVNVNSNTLMDTEFELKKSSIKNWEHSKLAISKNIKEIIWKAWIKPLTFIKYEKNILHISADSELIITRAQTQYYETIFFEASKNFIDLKDIKIEKVQTNKSNNTLVDNKYYSSKSILPVNNDLSFSDSITMKTNPNLTFSNFVVGHSNQMPFAASKRICESQSFLYNPLFIYGRVGMGKTHLLNAIGIELKKRSANLKIAFMSAERFMYQFIKAIRIKDTLKFKDEFRSMDILIIDDIQFIGGKDSTQEEFLHTFSDLIDQGKQIIISSNKSPLELSGLDEKLKSRLGGGLVVDFLPTDFELRIGILNKKTELLKYDVPRDVIEFLANMITNNIRELEGALNRICANYELTGRKINIENCKTLLSDILLINEKKISISFIQEQVTRYFNLKQTDMTSSRRSINIARPRQIAMYLCKEKTSCSYPEIGKAFGGKDHTTVMHAVKKIEKLLDFDNRLKKQLIELRSLMLSI